MGHSRLLVVVRPVWGFLEDLCACSSLDWLINTARGSGCRRGLAHCRQSAILWRALFGEPEAARSIWGVPRGGDGCARNRSWCWLIELG